MNDENADRAILDHSITWRSNESNKNFSKELGHTNDQLQEVELAKSEPNAKKQSL